VSMSSEQKGGSLANARFYERIRSYFAYKLNAVKGKEGTPTTKQLVAYIHGMKLQVDSVLGGNRPAKVIDPIIAAFSSIGWDWGKNAPKGMEPPTIKTVTEMLTSCCKTFFDLVRIERQKVAEKLEPTESDLQSLDNGVDKLWELDVKNRLKPGKDYELDLQCGKKPYHEGDRAPRPLFKYVNEEAINQRPTYKAFLNLLDNYERAVAVPEVETYHEKKEIQTFLNKIMETDVMKYCHQWLEKKKLTSGDVGAFKKLLQKIWFEPYKREYHSKAPDSSGFEHVFVGEERDGKIIGCHNWIQLWHEEKHGNLNYLGFIYPKRRGADRDEDEHLMTIQYEWREGKGDKTWEIKPVGTSWVGVSPEFEIALYTMCFLAGEKENNIDVGPYRVLIKCYFIMRNDGDSRRKLKYLSTSYPEEAPYTKEEDSYNRF